MKIFTNFLLTSFFAFTISAISAQSAMLQIIHNSPDPAANFVDIYVDDVLAVDDLAFRSGTGFVELTAEQDIDVSIAPSTSTSVDDALATFTYNLEADQNYIAIASGLLSTLGYQDYEPFDLAVFDMGRTNAQEIGNTDLLVYHGAPGAPTVDIYEDEILTNAELINDVSYGEFGGDPAAYQSLPTDNYGIEVRLSDGTTLVEAYEAPLAELSLDGQAGVVYASGFIDPVNNNDGPAFGLWLTLADGTTYALPINMSTANVQVIHNSPDPAADEVDIYIDGALALDNLTFRDATEFLEIPAEQDIEIAVAPGNSSDVNDAIGTFFFDLEADANYILMAAGLLNDAGYENFEPLSLVLYPTALTESGADDETAILVFHGSPDTGVDGIQQTAIVDIREVGIGLGLFIDNLEYGTFTQNYLNLTTDNYYLQIAEEISQTEFETYAVFLEDADLGGAALVAFSSGFLDPSVNNDGPALGLWVALPDGTTLPLQELGETPTNNSCGEAAPISIEDLSDCPDNAVSGDLTAAWNASDIDELPICELEGVLPDVYYTISTGNFNELTINIESLVEGGSEIGFQLYTACTEVAEGPDPVCVYNASVQDDVVISDVPTNTEYILRIFTNLDFGNIPGEFNICVSGQFIENVEEFGSESLIDVYPNPSNGQFTIENGSDSKQLNIDVLDMEGRTIYKSALDVSPQGQTSVNLTKDLSEGLYLMRIIREDGAYEMKKIVIE